MDNPEDVARRALDRAKSRLVECGLVDGLRELTQDVWRGVVDRHEPSEFGDTHMSQSILAVEDLKTRAQRRAHHNDLEPTERHWLVEGLDVSTPKNSLTITLPVPGCFPIRMVTYKTPVVECRRPSFQTMVDWRTNSETRLGFAKRNTNALGGYKTTMPGQDKLFSYPSSPWALSDFMWLWAGEEASPLTAGWLAVPVLGAVPFAAIEPLWWDEEPLTDVRRHGKTPNGPSFDARMVPAPGIKIRRRSEEENA